MPRNKQKKLWIWKFFFILYISLFTVYAYASSNTPLPAEQVFQLHVTSTGTDSYQFLWNIAPNYYLYKDRIKIKALTPGILVGSYQYPQALSKDQGELGIQKVYEKQLILNIPIATSKYETFQLSVQYQGCAEWGFCYPPISKKLEVDLKNQTIEIENLNKVTQNIIKAEPTTSLWNLQHFLSNVNSVQNILTDYPLWSLPLFLLLGFMLSLTPCVLPMIPILSSLIVNQQENSSTKKGFFLSLTYVLSMAFTFAFLGVAISLIGKNLQLNLQTPFILSTFALLFIILGFGMIGAYEFRLPTKLANRMNRVQQRQKGGNYLNVAIMGVLATLIVSPCITPPLVGVLAYISHQGNVVFGALALWLLGFGMGIPLMLIGTSLSRWLPKSGAWMELVKGFFGFVMFGVAISLLARFMAGHWILLISGFFTISLAICIYQTRFWILENTFYTTSSLILSINIFIIGLLWIIGGSAGNSNFFQPFANFLAPSSMNSFANAPTPQVNTISSLNQLQAILKTAKLENKPVILDFYADWCSACVIMEKEVFNQPAVINALKNFTFVRADVTPYNQENQELMKAYNIIAPPTIVFFNRDGNEIANKRIIGEISKNGFLKVLHN